MLTCGHFLPVGRAGQLLRALAGIDVSTGFLAGIRGRAARKLEKRFLAHVRSLLVTAPVLHADETCGRAAGALSYVHVACTEYLTLMHIGGRTREDIDAGGVLAEYSGVLVRDGYAGYEHLTQALHAWCGAHLLRDLRALSDADPQEQLWALAMANTLLDAHHTAHTARAGGADNLDPATLARIRNLYRGALARGQTDNKGNRSSLATDARTLIRRFRRYEDMILRFATDLTVPFTNNTAERAIRPVKIQQRTSGGTWRTLQGLADFAIVQSYLDTATKWALNKLDVLRELFTTGAWLPPALTQLNSYPGVSHLIFSYPVHQHIRDRSCDFFNGHAACRLEPSIGPDGGAKQRRYRGDQVDVTKLTPSYAFPIQFLDYRCVFTFLYSDERFPLGRQQTTFVVEDGVGGKVL